MANETVGEYALKVDRGIAVGNSPPPSNPDGRRRIHVYVANESGEPLPITVENMTSIEATSAEIINLSTPLANTEYSQLLPLNTKKFSLRVRGIATTRVAWVSGETATNYFTIPPGCTMSEDLVKLDTITVYLRTDKPSQIIEIQAWKQ